MKGRVITAAMACIAGILLTVNVAALAARRNPRPRPPEATVVYQQPPAPEVNPWADKGIASKYVFGAYYTRKNVQAAWNADSRTDATADIMVRFDNSADELVFWRGSGYLPYWKTSRGQFSFQRLEPQSDNDPNHVNRNSHATIIESSPKRVVIHWRYMTAFPKDVGVDNLPDQTECADEYFLITPDHKVVRALRPGAEHVEDWQNPARVKVSKFKLTAGGIEPVKADPADRKAALALMDFPTGRPRVVMYSLKRTEPASPAPAVSWSFDEGMGRTAEEAATHIACKVQGHAALWQTGVSGSALIFDGYTSRVALPAAKAPKITNKLTLSAWVAVGAYPWNDTALVQQGDVIADGKGYFLGFDADGKPTLAAMIDGKKCVLTAEDPNDRLQRFRWTQVTGVVDTDAGKMALYVDGHPAGSADVPKGKPIDLATDADVVVGQGPKLPTQWPVGHTFGNFQCSVDGMIDEVRVYDTALSIKQAAAAYDAMKMTDQRRMHPDFQRRVLPAGLSQWKGFGAHFTHLKYHPSWDNMFCMSGQPDIVVTFDKQPGRYVLWHGVGYIPMMVSENGRWYSNEFNETWWRGCCEPMSDKKVVFGYVQIIEQSPARVVLKWRFPESNVGYQVFGENPKTGWGDWCEWYFTIYPDGTVTKKQRVYAGHFHSHEWQESMAIMGPDQRPEAVVETKPALYIGASTGEVRSYDWITAPPARVDYKDAILHIVNLKADYDPYTIARFTGGNVYKARGPSPYAVFPAWNHWPVAQIPSDGRFVHYPDRAAHSSLTHVYWGDSVKYGEKGSYEEKNLLEGLSNLPPKTLLTLAKSFVNPAAVTAESKGVTAVYDPAQKAYVLTRASGRIKDMKVRLAASADSPVVHPAIVVANWSADSTATIKIDGRSPSEKMDVRQGVVPRANGVNALVVWMNLESTRPVTVELAQ